MRQRRRRRQTRRLGNAPDTPPPRATRRHAPASRKERRKMNDTLRNIFYRALAVFLVAVAAAVTINFIATPLYGASYGDINFIIEKKKL